MNRMTARDELRLANLRLSLFDLNFGTGVYSGMLIEAR
jgi:hypothetical protein